MKVKVRGLVFVGFAAAVFAQSAFATITPNTADKKIVTSKYYVDSTFEAKADKIKIGSGTGEVANVSAITETQWSNSNLYPSMPVLKGLVDSIDVNVGVSSNATDYLDVTDNQNGTFTLNLDNAPATTAAELTGPLTSDVAGAFTGTDGNKLVTATAVKALINTESSAGNTTLGAGSTNATVPTSRNVVDYAEAKANKATAIIPAGETGANSTSNDAYPTTAAVYNFVTSQVGGAAYQRKLTSDDTGTLYVGQYDGSASESTWKQIGTKGYLTYAQNGTSGVYEFDIDSSQIADASSEIATTSTNLATAGAVYDFVSGGYQPKTTGTDVMVGYNGTWRSLAGDSYITVAADTNGSSVTLGNMTGSASDFVATVASNDASYDTVSAARAKLAKSGDVYDFVTGLTGGLTIPEMPDGCETVAATGGYCALVYGLISGTAGQQGATYGLQWTVMAPDTMPTGTGD